MRTDAYGVARSTHDVRVLQAECQASNGSCFCQSLSLSFSDNRRFGSVRISFQVRRMYVTLVDFLVNPHFLLLAVNLLLATWLLWRGKGHRRSASLLVLTALLLILISYPPVVAMVVSAWERGSPPLETIPDAEAIVVLASGDMSPFQGMSSPRIAESTIRRCLFAATLYREGGKRPVIVAGGRMYPDRPPIAETMGDLLRDLGVAPEDILLETESTDTYENALFANRLLAERKLNRILLVTDAIHMPRAKRCFENLGLDVVAAPSHHYGSEAASHLEAPKHRAVEIQHRLAYEFAGYVWFAIRGKLNAAPSAD